MYHYKVEKVILQVCLTFFSQICLKPIMNDFGTHSVLEQILYYLSKLSFLGYRSVGLITYFCQVLSVIVVRLTLLADHLGIRLITFF